MRYTDQELETRGVKEELRTVIKHLQQYGTISNSEVQHICKVSKATATRYLRELEGEFIQKVGTTGAGTIYVLKGLTKGSE